MALLNSLSAGQKAALLELLRCVKKEQDGVVIYQSNLSAGTARRDSKYDDLESALVALGETPPSPITVAHTVYSSDGSLSGVYLNETNKY